MALEVIGAGFGRTGTLSLKLALEKLGVGPCYHMIEVAQHPEHRPLWSAAHAGAATDWEALFAGYRATTDWPACNLWRELADAFPEARVLLSRRDPERWYDSVMNTIYPSTTRMAESDDPDLQAFSRWADELVWQRCFDGRMEDRAHVMGVFERHNDTVIASLPAERLLVFEASEGWGPLCRFLDVPQPDEDYPRTNTSEQFAERHASDAR